jgi:pyruvate dehydrogenase E2 component (dihydrolipoamide acetyltransferase)
MVTSLQFGHAGKTGGEMANVVVHKMKDPSSFRRIAASAWPLPKDSTIYGSMEIRAQPLVDWLAARSAETGIKLTVTHAVARAVGLTLRAHPDLNGLIRFGSIYLRPDVDLFLQVAIPAEDGSTGKTDLSGVKIRQVDGKTCEELATELRAKAKKIRANQDEDLKRTKGMLEVIPAFLLRPVMLLIDFLTYDLNLNLRWAGIAKDTFGSAMVTSVGMFGITTGYAPIFPLAHCPILILIGALEQKAKVRDGQVVAELTLNLSGSFDHRMVDGFHAGKFAGHIKKLLEDPTLLET